MNFKKKKMHLFCNLNFFHTSILSQFVMLWLYGKLPKVNNITKSCVSPLFS